MNYEQIKNKVAELQETQGFEKTFDYTRSFIAKAGTAGAFSIPMTTEGPFYELGYNIRYTKNSTITRGGVTTNICAVRLKVRSQADNAAQSNDYIPVQLIATPGADDAPRYGSRPFTHIYPKGDNIVIEYDNRAPEVLVTGDVYDMHDEKIDICFNGKIYPIL